MTGNSYISGMRIFSQSFRLKIMKKNPSTFVKVAVKNKVLTRYNGVSIAVRLGKLKNLNIYVSQGSAATRLR